MNKRRFRVVFNQLRGLMMVVAETTSSTRRASRRSLLIPVLQMATLRPITFALLVASGQLVSLNPALADIVADPSAPGNQRPVITNTANGLPLVNIQTPSAAGVSRNAYSRFNVDQPGAILNNSHSNVQTQLGGWVPGNPLLAGGTARIILNEVNSQHPSLLNGFIEVAGSRAQVVVANPAGIHCDGCGFINANRATLTTGTPIIHGGDLLGYRVGGGSVRFLGSGLDTSQVNFTDVIARAVEANAGLWANALNVVTGSNQVKVDRSGNQTDITPIAPDAGDAAPVFAIDVAALGGMYANKIHMTGTEAGLGVRNAGTLGAGVGEFTLTSAGQLINRGAINAGSTHIQSADIDNAGSGVIYGDRLTINADTVINGAVTVDGVTKAGTIAARERLDLAVNTLENRDNALIFSAGDLAIGGSLDAAGQASGQADTLINENATIEALGNATLAAADLQNRNAGLETELVVDDTQRILEVQPEGWPRRYDISRFPSIHNYGIEKQPFLNDNGNISAYFEDYTYYDYTATTRSTHVIASLPGRIISGGDMVLRGNITNSDSQIIAGGDLDIAGPTLQNLATPGQQIISYSGWQQFRDWDGNDEELEFGPIVPYSPAPHVSAIDLGVSQLANNSVPADGDAPLAIGSLFHPVPDTAATYLIETDARFANYRTWLSSDYMLAQLSFDPATMQKRLGDGFYEQRLVREQVAQLTGRRFLEGHASDEAQYQALMDAGITVANAWQLVPGVALTAEQIAQLTSDIIWLVTETVTLPDGTVAQALVPKVYVRLQAEDLHPTIGLMAGNSVTMNLSGDATNSGTIAGRTLVALNADNIQNLGGQMQANVVSATAAKDIDIQGGTLAAQDALVLQAGDNLTVASTTVDAENHVGNSTFTRTNVERLAGLYVTGEAGILVASAGSDANLLAAQIVNAGQNGVTVIDAGNNLNLGTVTVAEQNNSIHSTKIFNRSGHTQEVGTTIQTQGDIALNAGSTLTARAAEVSSAAGTLTARADDISIEAGSASYNSDIGWASKRSGTLSSRKKVQRDSFNEQTSVGSSLSADTVTLQSDSDISITGSNLVSDSGTTLAADGNITVQAAQQTFEETHYQKTKRSGISTSGASVSIGSQQLMTNTDTTRTTQSGSTVGSVGGDVTIEAGKTYTQQASDVLAPQGDIDITAQQVNIEAAQNTGKTVQETKFKQSGITLALSNPIVNAVQTAEQMKQAASNTSDSRMQALAAGTTALAAKNAYGAVQTAQTLDQTGKTAVDAANQIGGVNLSISIGSSKSRSKSTQTSSTAQGSQVMAGGDINITASGAGEDSDINVIGSQIKAGNNVTLVADDEVNLIAAQNTGTLNSKNKSSSSSVGASIGTVSGLAVTASASKGKGKASSTDVTWTKTTVEAGNKVALESGTDTNLIGAQVKGNQVVADVGTSGEGNLNIQSLQDTSSYDSKQKSTGISASVPIGAGMAGGSFNSSNSKINSDYASVNEQAGIFAGDEGFQVNVNGNTNLKGAVIASTEQAIQDDRNSLTTETLTVSDIQNRAEYEASSSSFGLSLSYDSTQSVTKNIGNNLVNVPATLTPELNQDGSDSSLTRSAISPSQITISDDEKQKELTGKNAEMTIATLNRDTDTANNDVLTKPDITAIQNEIAANTSIVSTATQQVTTAINSYYVKRMAEYDQQYNDKLNLARDKEAEAAFLSASGKTGEAEILIAEAQTLRYQAIDLRNERDNPSLSQGLALTLGNILVGSLAGEIDIANTATSYAVGTLGNAFLLTAKKRDSDITQGFVATCNGKPTECAEAASRLGDTINNAKLPLEERLKALTSLEEDNKPLFEIRAVDSNSDGLFNIVVNGILNEPDRALVLGIGHLPTNGENQSIYLSYNDTQGGLADLLNAAIDQYAKATSNTSDAIVQALIASHGNKQGQGETNLLAHSGGTLSSNIALNDYAAQGNTNVNLHIDYFGPASSTGAAVAAALNAAGLAGATPEQQANWLAYGNTEGIKGISSGGLGYYNHANDPVPTFVGGNLGQLNQFNDPNSPTYLQGAQIGSVLQSIIELKALFTTSNSTHSTYLWNDPSTWPTATVAPVSSDQ